MKKFIRFIKSKIKRGNEESDNVGACSQREPKPSGLHITDLPPVVLARIFEHCSYDVLARRVRLVCKRFCEVATSVLNRGFSTLGQKIDRAMVDAVSHFEEGRTLEELLVKNYPFTLATQDVLPSIGQCRSTEQQLLMDQHYIALMLMKGQYRELRAFNWRHIYSPHSGSGHPACFYAGSLLDDFLRFLRIAHHWPIHLGLAMLNSSEKNEFPKLCTRRFIFTKHFEKRTKTFKRDYSISGAKLIDFCHNLTRKYVRMIPHEQAVMVNGTECHIEAHYRMPYTWLNFLPSSHAQPNQWSEDPRSIYLRMRQLINGRNHFFLEEVHHGKEMLITKPPYALELKYIVPSLHNAAHRNYGYLFFIGLIRRSAFDEERSPTVQLFDYFNLDFFTLHNETDTSDGVVNVPESSNMALDINKELHSSLRLTPIRFSDNSLSHIWKSSVTVKGYRQIHFR
ncbi:uncharacterized protein LOC110830511 [Zootermopsis nevadensis]|uniref:F-box domain-containing protein n=1 Tax=Zootermopsis nevadensis TaxID=136037 RepID=A0A067R617_ZOONE|nr:uncharacterized protein LOC110830511 [Zootermopsis nevadensis]KDR18809.1 hypothetical protein L798_07071 [Zootermopsis nevadensis]